MNHAITISNTQVLNRDTQTIFRLLESIEGGPINVYMPDNTHWSFGSGDQPVTLKINSEELFSVILSRGDIGFAETYLDNLWESNNLSLLLTILAKNRNRLKRAVYGSWLSLISARIRHIFNRNSKTGSKKNIVAHYDLGNAFYSEWLDETMSYSSADFCNAITLQDAQNDKYQRILNNLNTSAGESILEIGSGWGGFAEVALKEKLDFTGITLSPAQLDWSRKRLPDANFKLQDYRDVSEQFDNIVSIEMFEAVGEQWWPTYFQKISSALKPGGTAVIQTITIDDDLFANYRKGTDFIQQYIFPGGMLPSKTVFRQLATKHGLQVRNEHSFGNDYAQTLSMWRESFESKWHRISNMGFDEKFRRLWNFYLAYCEAGFLAKNIDVVQFELTHG